MPNSHTDTKEERASGDICLGLVLLAFSVAAFFLFHAIKTNGLGNNDDPGPRAFPFGLCAILALGGIVELWQGYKAKKAIAGLTPTGPIENKTSQPKTVLLLLACFLLYVVLLPLIGFLVTTLILGTAMMVILGNPWKRSALVSIALVSLIYLLFVLFFRVPLPEGIFTLPF